LLKHPKDGEKAGEPTLRATSAGIRALKYFGGKVLDPKAAAEFVAICHDEKTGGFANTPGGKADVFSTAVGLMAVVELNMPLEKYALKGGLFLSQESKTFEEIRIAVAGLEALKTKTFVTTSEKKPWLELIAKMQNDDGTFGEGNAKARLTGGAAVAILRLGGELKEKAAILKAIKEGQHLNGGWGKGEDANSSDLETSYRVMRAFHMLKELPKNVEGIRTYVEKCRNNDGGYGVAPGEESTVSGCYYAAIIHHWLKEK
jgi:prenyltransferase beta subunit